MIFNIRIKDARVDSRILIPNELQIFDEINRQQIDRKFYIFTTRYTVDSIKSAGKSGKQTRNGTLYENRLARLLGARWNDGAG